VAFNPSERKFTLEGTSEAQFGNYDIKFSVTLPEYTSFAAQTFTFPASIVPNCAASTFTAPTIQSMSTPTSSYVS